MRRLWAGAREAEAAQRAGAALRAAGRCVMRTPAEWRAFHRACAENDTATGLLAKDAPATWTDHEGRTWQTPQIIGRLKPGKCPGHAALRASVIQRDGGKCCWCGSTASLVADHIISRRNGGAHHPNNLRALCDSCNAAKAGLVDTRGEAA